MVKEGGRIFLKASQDAYVDGAGRIVATGTKGGSIEVLGKRVAVTDQAQLEASGDAGGGTVLVGGDAHGANPDVQNATMTYVGPNASIKADATQNGDGGMVIVWSDDYTQFYGAISARGGAQSGNGGFVETSGATLKASGTVNTSAPYGTIGSWLLDPDNIDIVNGNPDNSTTYTTDLNDVNGFNVNSPGYSSIEVASINSSSTTVTLQANNNVNFNASVAMTAPGAGLTAQAGNNINLNAYNITTTGGTVTLIANDNSNSTATGSGIITSSPGYGNITHERRQHRAFCLVSPWAC